MRERIAIIDECESVSGDQVSPPVSRQGFLDEYITDLNPEAHAHIKKIVDANSHGPLFTPTAKSGGLIHPGFRGGPLWGGCCFDPQRNLLFVPSAEWTNRVALRDGTPDEPFRYA